MSRCYATFPGSLRVDTIGAASVAPATAESLSVRERRLGYRRYEWIPSVSVAKTRVVARNPVINNQPRDSALVFLSDTSPKKPPIARSAN